MFAAAPAGALASAGLSFLMCMAGESNRIQCMAMAQGLWISQHIVARLCECTYSALLV